MNKTADLAYWITERYSIKLRKDAGAPLPWTPDHAMRYARYCNVHREDDRVTKWIAENWRNPNAAHPNLTLGMVLARMVNWPATLAELNFPHEWNAEAVKSVLRARAARGQKVWTSAYTISTCGRSMPKEDYVVDHVCEAVAEHFWGWEWTTLSEAHAGLCVVDGLGSFLSAQVIADLKNTPGHALGAAQDWWTWCAPGPGSLRGLSWYFYGKPDVSIPPKHFSSSILKCYEEVKPLLPDYIPPIHMQDFQNCLCEFSKYMRIRHGDRRVRNKYVPRQDNDREV